MLLSPIRHPVNFRLLIFDVDGTLRRCTIPGQPCPNAPGEWELLPNVQATLQQYRFSHAPEDKRAMVVSNQGGVGLGYLTEAVCGRLLLDTIKAAFGYTHSIYFYLCPHAPTQGCVCRKPLPFLLHLACYEANETQGPGEYIGLGETLYIGDMDSDRDAAERAGVTFCWAQDFFHESAEQHDHN